MANNKTNQYGYQIPGRDNDRNYYANTASAQTQPRQDALPDFSRMTKKELKQFDDTEGSYKRLLGDKPITWFWLMNHYSKPNAEAYKAQKEGRSTQKQHNNAPSTAQAALVQQSQEYPREMKVPQQEVQPIYRRDSFSDRMPQQDEYFEKTVFIDHHSSPTTVMSPKGYLNCLGFNQEVEITKTPFRIGRNPRETDLCIADNEGISGIHAEIVFRDGMYCIIDLNSLNHVYVDGAKIPVQTSVLLRNGTMIELGNEKFSFRTDR